MVRTREALCETITRDYSALCNRNGDDSHTSGTGARRTERVARECTYQDFMKCQPLYFKGTEGVVELTQWSSDWWNSHVRIVGLDVAMFPDESDKVARNLDNNHQAATTTSMRQEWGPNYAAGLVKEKTSDAGTTTAVQQVQFTTNWPMHWHYKSDCPKLKNRNHGNQAEVSPWKGVVRFGKRGKLNPRDAGPFKALARVEALATIKLPRNIEFKRMKQIPFQLSRFDELEEVPSSYGNAKTDTQKK
ncbi:hypothetical protein Tco_0853713 [Tanacetum coccineum]